MRCLSCDYDLSASLAGPCPECGRLFDSANPATYRNEAARDTLTKPLLWMNFALALSPVLTAAMLHLCLVGARVSLGRWPHRWGLDDPKGIDGIQPLLWGTYVAMLAMPPSFAIGLLLLAFLVALHRRHALRAALVFVALWATGLAILGWDPAGAGLWFMD